MSAPERQPDHLPRRLWWVLAGLTFAWGFNWTAMKVALSAVPPWTFRSLCLGLGSAVLFLVLRLLTHKLGALKSPGLVAGTFLSGYALARSFSEIFREPHAVHFFNIGPFTAGQVYCLPMLVAGLYLIWRARQEAAFANS